MYSIYWEIYGCEMNKSQAYSLKKYLENYDIRETKEINEANLVIMYTCSVRKSAEDRALGRLGYFKHIKMSTNPNLKVCLMGCMGEIGEYQFVQNDLADLVIGTTNQEQIKDLIDKVINDEYRGVYGNNALETTDLTFLPSAPDMEFPFRSYVSIIHGCSNYCSYCIVPYLRGKEYSRKSDDILNDIKKMSDIGVKEILLLGQNVNAYGIDNGEIPFYKLLEKVSDINGIELISFMSPHPKDFDNNLIDIVVERENISKVVHLPLQSGSDRMLELMKRRYDYAKYSSIIERFRKKSENINFTTDIIVGFNGETEDDYNLTLKAVRENNYIDAFMYKYSPRPLVKKKFDDNINDDIKSLRLSGLIDLQQEISVKLREKMIGTEKKSLILKESKKESSKMLFKSFDGINGVVETDLKPGEIVNLKLIDLNGKTFVARSVE